MTEFTRVSASDDGAALVDQPMVAVGLQQGNRHAFSDSHIDGAGKAAFDSCPLNPANVTDAVMNGNKVDAEDWLANLKGKMPDVMNVLDLTYGSEAPVWFQRWKLFFLACAELFAYDEGTEWIVSHQRLKPSGKGFTS